MLTKQIIIAIINVKKHNQGEINVNFENTFKFAKKDSNENIDSLIKIAQFLFIEFNHIFGQDIISGDECLIFNDKEAECPEIFTTATPIILRLSQKSLNYWCQTIFQLSHELCHYAISQHKDNKNITLSWFEEIVCEAVSLYFLKWASDNWHLCELYQSNPWYSKSIADYLNNELNKKGTTEFINCTSLDALRRYEQTLSTNRETHRNERNYLYQYILKEPTQSKCFCDYTRYIDSNGITIDFNKWLDMENSQLLRIAASLQPC